MKRRPKLLSLAALAVSISFLGLTALADNARGPGLGRPGGGGTANNFHGSGYSSGFSTGYRGGYSGGYRSGYYGGYRGGYYGGYHHYYGGWGGGWYPWNFSFSYVYAPPPYYYYDDYPPPVYYSPPAVVYSSPPPAPAAESPQQPPAQYSPQYPSRGVADIKALVKAGISDEVILSQIRNSRAVYHLTAAEIIDLKESGVSEKVIDYMINTAASQDRR